MRFVDWGAAATRSGRWGRLGLLLGVCFLAFFVNLGAQELGLMEARNFVAAREIHEGGSWLLPTMNGQLRLAKPPLPTWLVAAVMQLTGNTTDLGVLRLPSALGATLLVLGFWRLAARLVADARTAWLAALVLATSLLMMTVGRDGNGWDVYCYTFMVWALLLLVRGWQSEERAYGWFAGAGALIGLSMLSKGPVAPYGMLLPFLVAWAWQGGVPALRQHGREALLAATVALLVGGTWPLYVLSQHLPDALAVAQIESSSWAGRHVKPFWFYLPFPVFTGLWAWCAVLTLVWPFARPRLQSYVPYLLVLGWALATVLVLSVVPEKKERYLLPVLPPMALLVAGLLRHWLAASLGRPDQRLVRTWGALLMLFGLSIPLALGFAELPGYTTGSGWFAAVAFWFASIGLCALVGGVWRARPLPLVAGSLAATVGFTVLLMGAYPHWQHRRDEPGLRSQAALVAAHPRVLQVPVFSLGGEMHIKWIWMAGRRVPAWQPGADSTLPARQLPLMFYSGFRPQPAHFGGTWRPGLQMTVLDSFNLGSRHQDGQWYLSELATVPD
ncbi:ArnT family glycosyltransferase [Hymenobacter sp. B81]|uniref:ArnT family glycosyltransferase n=1 Tax=Hymenobacter sp. B81 TaxID=3344878 RepID=UPI0037DCE42F